MLVPALPFQSCQSWRRHTAYVLQLGGTGRIPAGATASIELSGPDARATNNPGYYQHSAESKALADVSPADRVSLQDF